MSKLGERAVVCGAGMGGLLAARVLADFYETVTLVERDKLPDTGSNRRSLRPDIRAAQSLQARPPSSLTHKWDWCYKSRPQTPATPREEQFFTAAAEVIGPLWASNQFNDLYLVNANPAHSASKEILDFREAVLSAAENSSALTEKLYRSMNLVDPPTDYSPLLQGGGRIWRRLRSLIAL